MAEQEFVEGFGALNSLIDVRDYKLKKQLVKNTFPATFELEMCDVKNQWFVGSCVAHAVAETIEYHNKVQDKITDKVSVGFIYGNRRNTTHKSGGMYVREALQNACEYGDCFEADFPENKEVPKAIDLFEKRFDNLKEKAYPNRFSTYFRVESDDDIKYALINYGPVIFTMYWYKDVKLKDGIISTSQNKKKSKGIHCMVIYGWNKDGWLIQNSWGTLWGKKGRAILPFNIKKNEAWGVSDEVVGENTDIKKPFHKSLFLKFVAKVLNLLSNLFKKKN